MSVTYQISESDYVGCALLNGEMSHKSKKWHLAIDSLLVLCGLLVLYFGHPIVGSALIGAGVGGAFVPLAIRRMVFPYFLKWHYKKYRLIQKPISIHLEDSGIQFSTDDGTSSLKWKDIHSWRENGNYLLVYLAPKIYHLIPKRIAKDGFNLERLRESLQQRVGSAT